MNDDQPHSIIQTENASSLVTIVQPRRQITMYSVSETEIDEFGTGYLSMDQMLFGLVAGTFVSTGIVLWTVLLDPVLKAVFAGIAFASFVLALFFLGRVLKERAKMGQRISGIKSQHAITSSMS